MAIIKLTLAYEGTHYHGWQKQSALPTVQDAIEHALSQLTQQTIPIYGAGRTDAGVHALGQVAHFSSNRRFQPEDWVRALNALLPKDIAVKRAEAVDDAFHARYSAKEKHYRYFIQNSPQRNPFSHRTSWFLPERLDIDQMAQAAQTLRGEHIFTSFCAAGSEVKNHRIHIKEIQVQQEADQVVLSFQAPRFLQYMVRNLVGFLVEVGRSKRRAEEVSEILAAKDRRVAGPTGPPQGLFLIKIVY